MRKLMWDNGHFVTIINFLTLSSGLNTSQIIMKHKNVASRVGVSVVYEARGLYSLFFGVVLFDDQAYLLSIDFLG